MVCPVLEVHRTLLRGAGWFSLTANFWFAAQPVDRPVFPCFARPDGAPAPIVRPYFNASTRSRFRLVLVHAAAEFEGKQTRSPLARSADGVVSFGTLWDDRRGTPN